MTTHAPTTPTPADDAATHLKTMPMSEAQQQLGTTPDGLSHTEATQRLAEYGPNEIAEHHTNALLKFLSYFWGPIP